MPVGLMIALLIRRRRVLKIAIPRMGECIAPCLECSATITIFSVEDGSVLDQIDFPISSREPLDRIRLLRDQKVDTIICAGVQDTFGDLVRASGIKMISWVSGSIEELLIAFLEGRLVPGNGGDTQSSDSGGGATR
jgi:predicted Fe-Mo cluster-binding NifX family protein